jgi:cation transport protein ChaC
MSERDLIERRRLSPPPGEDFWVFAYGSLMWNPGFPFLESHPALVRGYHRSFCVESTHYRGTKEKPGLVLSARSRRRLPRPRLQGLPHPGQDGDRLSA